jgi:hypothetical protein
MYLASKNDVKLIAWQTCAKHRIRSRSIDAANFTDSQTRTENKQSIRCCAGVITDALSIWYRTPLSSADVEAGLPSPGKFDWSADHVHSLARAVSRHRRVRSAAGAVLVVAAVEATWRLQRAARRPLPKFLHSMTVPVSPLSAGGLTISMNSLKKD